MKLVRDKTRSKSNYYWYIHAKLDSKKEKFKSNKDFFKYWNERPYFCFYKFKILN